MNLSDRQVAITLAALRYIQERIDLSPMFAMFHLEGDPIVTEQEIDAICDIINEVVET